MTIKLPSGKLLYVQGAAPKKAGDTFAAADKPIEAPAPRRTGCVAGVTSSGAAFFSCSRGRSSSSAAPPEVKLYKFNPDIHEVLP